MPEPLEKARSAETLPLSVQTTRSKVPGSESLSKEFSYYKVQKEKPVRNTRYVARPDRKFVMEPIAGITKASKPENPAQYAYAGRLPEVMQKDRRPGRSITADKNKPPALNAAAYRYNPDKAFAPKCRTDAKKMQKASHGAASNKIRPAGKNGCPSFEEQKKKVENSPVTAKLQAITAKKSRA